MMFALAACGGNNIESAPPEIVEYSNDYEYNYAPFSEYEPDEDFEDFEPEEDAFMNAMYNLLMEYAGVSEVLHLIALELLEAETPEDIAEVHQELRMMKESVSITLEILLASSPYIPQDHAPTFTSFSAAVYLVLNAMQLLNTDISEIEFGDDAAIFAAVEAFQATLSVADTLIWGE
jgi:hypothetical protein